MSKSLTFVFKTSAEKIETTYLLLSGSLVLLSSSNIFQKLVLCHLNCCLNADNFSPLSIYMHVHFTYADITANLHPSS